MRSALLGLTAAGLWLAAACTDVPTGPAPLDDLAAEWPVSTPAAAGLDASKIQAAIAKAKTLPRLLSLLVVRNGTLAVEEYFNGNHRDSLNDVRSVTKSVVSTLVGAAAFRGILPTLDGPLTQHLPAQHLPRLTPATGAITVRQLLTMSSGFQWDEQGVAEYNAWVVGSDPVGYLLARPLVASPGANFTYNSAAVHLLSVALTGAIARPLDDFAAEALFAPLGIGRVRWERLADGAPNGGSGLDLRPRDMAKIGAVWLAGGSTGSVRVFSESYRAAAATQSFGTWSMAPVPQYGYGYLWWVARTPHGDGFFAWGYGGQFIFVVPAKAMVVVVTTEWRGAGDAAPQQALNGLDLIVNGVLAAAP
ncbi:MAG: serine hydrolase domain-containing protein [Gemmatimonadales bacterium]